MLIIFSALIFLLPLATALTLNIPTVAVNSAGPVTVTWTAAAGDPPTFNLYLVNAAFHNSFALSNTVITSSGTVTLNLPLVQAGSAYQLQATQVSNINAVLAITPVFAIGAPTTTSSSTTSTTGSLTSSGISTTTGSNTLSQSTSGSTTGTTTPSSTAKAFNGASSVGINGYTGAFAIAAAAAGAALAGY